MQSYNQPLTPSTVNQRPNRNASAQRPHPSKAWNTVAAGGQSFPAANGSFQQVKNVWGNVDPSSSSPVATIKKRPDGLGVGVVGRRGEKVMKESSDWQQDSGLAEEDTPESTLIDISKAYQGCLNKYSNLFPESCRQDALVSSLDKIGSSCSIYVTEISSPNLFLGIENNQELKQSFQKLKKQLQLNFDSQIQQQNSNKSIRQARITQNTFVCVNDRSEGVSRGFVVSITNQICDVYLIDWGYINAYPIQEVWGLPSYAIGFCRPLARLFEIAGAPTDLPFPDGLNLPALFHVKVMAHNSKCVSTVVKVKYKGRDLIDYYYEPGLLKQAEEAGSGPINPKSPPGGTVKAPPAWGPKNTINTNPSQGGAADAATYVVGAAGAVPPVPNVTVAVGDESNSGTNSVVEEWLMNTADEQFSHFDEGPPSPTDDEALANLMEAFELGDSVSAVVHHPPPVYSQQPHQIKSFNQQLTVVQNNHHPAGHRNNPQANFATHGNHPNNSYSQNINSNYSFNTNYSHHQNQAAGRNNSANRTPDQLDGGSPRNMTSISSKLDIKTGSNVKILISYVVLPTFFNFIPINQTTNKFREQLKTLLNSFITSAGKKGIDSDPNTGQPVVFPGQYFVSKIRGEVRRVTVKPGHQLLEKNKFVKIQDVDYGGEIIARCNEVFKIPEQSAEAIKNIPVLRCNGSMNGLHPNSTTRRWSPEQCQSFRQLTESNIMDATVARVTLSPQMSVPYYNFDLYYSHGNQFSIADIMRAFEYAS